MAVETLREIARRVEADEIAHLVHLILLLQEQFRSFPEAYLLDEIVWSLARELLDSLEENASARVQLPRQRIDGQILFRDICKNNVIELHEERLVIAVDCIGEIQEQQRLLYTDFRP